MGTHQDIKQENMLRKHSRNHASMQARIQERQTHEHVSSSNTQEHRARKAREHVSMPST